MRKGVCHGEGTLIFPDGSEYKGMFNYGFMHGKGNNNADGLSLINHRQ